jgi:hypothetical protein
MAVLRFCAEAKPMRRPVRAAVLAAAVLAVTFAALECSRPASAEPLRVTYYYLPG